MTLLIFACLYPSFGKVGYNKNFFARSARDSCFVPHLKIHGAAHDYISEHTERPEKQYPNLRDRTPGVQFCGVGGAPLRTAIPFDLEPPNNGMVSRVGRGPFVGLDHDLTQGAGHRAEEYISYVDSHAASTGSSLVGSRCWNSSAFVGEMCCFGCSSSSTV